MLDLFKAMFPKGDYRPIGKRTVSYEEDKVKYKQEKAPISVTKFKEDSLQTILDKGLRLGWCVPQEYYVIDIDNKDCRNTSDKVIEILKAKNIRALHFSGRAGAHFVFKTPTTIKVKNAVQKSSAINVKVDVRTKGGYIILPFNDPDRKFVYPYWLDDIIAPTEEDTKKAYKSLISDMGILDIDECPYFLLPLISDTTNTFIGMDDGAGRNDALFKWVGKLKACHCNTDQIKESINIINEFLFAEPIGEKELDITVLRDSYANNDSDLANIGEKANKCEAAACQLIAKNRIISCDDRIFVYNGVYYVPHNKTQIEVMIHNQLSTQFVKAARREIYDYIILKTQIPFEELDKEWNLICLKNGVLDVTTKKLMEPTAEVYNTLQVPCRYDEHCSISPRIDDFFKQISGGSEKTATLLYEAVGYCLLKKNIFGKAFILQGGGATGKSTFINLVEKLIGSVNAAYVPLNRFSNDYYLATIAGKLINISDDLDSGALDYTGRFKSIITGEPISCRGIYEKPISFNSFATLIFACNTIPRLNDLSSGLYRRLVLLEVDKKIKNPDPLFLQKLVQADYEYLLWKAVDAIHDAIKRGSLTEDDEQRNLLKFKKAQSTINEYIANERLSIRVLHNTPCTTYYNAYKEWCSENGFLKVATAPQFRSEICSVFNIQQMFMQDDESKEPMLKFIDVEYNNKKSAELDNLPFVFRD